MLFGIDEYRLQRAQRIYRKLPDDSIVYICSTVKMTFKANGEIYADSFNITRHHKKSFDGIKQLEKMRLFNLTIFQHHGLYAIYNDGYFIHPFGGEEMKGDYAEVKDGDYDYIMTSRKPD